MCQQRGRGTGGRKRFGHHGGGLPPCGAAVNSGAHVGGQAEDFVPSAADPLGRMPFSEP